MRRVKWFWAAAVLGLAAAGCSSSGEPETPPDTAKPPTAAAFVTMAFETASGQGTITVSGNSPVAEWFASQPGVVSLDLSDADIDDLASVVEEAISFWFVQDENSGAVPPSILISADGKITDTHCTAYAVIAQLLPAAPGTETTAPGTNTTSASASVPGTTAAAAETPSEGSGLRSCIMSQTPIWTKRNKSPKAWNRTAM